ncbi:partner and localizer of BRCA2 [Eudromia elegans]
MAEPAGAALSGAEREQLRARLARLRREYSETASRLRRARRAERGGGARDAAEQKGPRGAPGAPLRPAGSGDTPSPTAGRHETCQLLVKSCSLSSTERSMSDTCKERPEFFDDKVNLSDTSQAESTKGSQENVWRETVRPAAEGRKDQATGGRMKLRRKRTKAVIPEEGESLQEVLLLSSEEKVKNETSSKEELGSPVFRRSRFSSTAEGACRASTAAAARGGSSSSPAGAELGAAPGAPEGGMRAVPGPPPRAGGDSSDAWRAGLPAAAAVSAEGGRTEPCPEKSESAVPGTSDSAQQEPPRTEKQMVHESSGEDHRELRSLWDLPSEKDVLPADRNNTVISKSGSSEGNQNEANDFNCFPTDPLKGNGEKLLETQELETESRVSHLEKLTTPEAESAMNSYTVVEGLLFPVEYYVRTTRRMSNRQRKVDLDAVILSQLGKSKKGLRNKCKQKDTNSDQPSQEMVDNDEESGVRPFPSLGAESSPVSSSSPQQSLAVSNSSSTSLGSFSQNSVASTEHEQRVSQRKQKGRRQSMCKPTVNQASQELPGHVDLTTLKESASVLANDCQSEKENSGGGSRRRGHRMDSAADPDPADSLFSFRSLQQLPSRLGIKDFHLPDEEFGLLKLEKFKSSPVNDLEVFVPSVSGDDVASEETRDPQMNAEKKGPESNVISPFKNVLSRLPHLESPASKIGLRTSELLFTPMETVLGGAPTQLDSQISASLFPVLGATPAVLPSVPSDILPDTPSVLPLPPKEASGQAVDHPECRGSVLPQDSGSCGEGSARKEEEQRAMFRSEAEGGADGRFDEILPLKEQEQPESREQGCCRARGEQEETASEPLAVVQLDGLREETLQLISKLKDSSRSCAVDVSTMWWEAAGHRELHVVTACETSVSLWKLLSPGHWGRVCAWQSGEIPVIQIIPLPDTCNLICIALGDLEIGEIRLLHYSSESDSFKQSLLKTGNIKAVLGLKGRRLVSSSRTAQQQQVEIVALSEAGRSKEGQTLMPPEDTVLAFAEVEGMRDALVGTTAVNSIVVWNLKTGQLLKKMPVGYSYPASICHRAYSDSGLLFVILSHPHAKESELCGNPAFRVVAFNPKTARSTGVVFSSLPPGHAGRYVEGEVAAAAAAVLSSGSIAVWEPRLGRCAALLPPAPGAPWALVRWAAAGAGLLAARRDGTVHLYRYAPGAAATAEPP